MAEIFLSVARQGRNGWWRYFLSLLTALGLMFNACLYVMLPIILITALLGQTLPESAAWQSSPAWFLGLSVVISGLLSLGLAIAIAAIHRRPWRTVLNPTGRLGWRRLLQGMGTWSGLMLLNLGVLVLVDRDRYVFTVTPQWLDFVIPVLIAIPLIVLMSSLVYGYLLQGLGLLVRRPVRLTATVALMLGGLGLVSSTQPDINALDVMAAFISAGFGVWIVLRNNGMELFMGIQATNLIIQLLLVRSPDETPAFPTLLTLTTTATSPLNFGVWMVDLALFYAVCFVWFPGRRRPQEAVSLSAEAEDVN